MSLLTSFPPVASRTARVLILGSMPGVESLRQEQYYAHPQNAFWYIMGGLFGAGPDLTYAARKRRLGAAGIALWDVLKHCERPGSLDSEIRSESMIVNDFAGFFEKHPRIAAIFFNGHKSEKTFERHVVPLLDARILDLPRQRLPSTSPAYAVLSRDEKLEQWRVVQETLAQVRSG
jgi:hypoxanthine-DNA glycosylase